MAIKQIRNTAENYKTLRTSVAPPSTWRKGLCGDNQRRCAEAMRVRGASSVLHCCCRLEASTGQYHDFTLVMVLRPILLEEDGGLPARCERDPINGAGNLDKEW